MPDVFISYSRRNLEFVQQLFDALKMNGKDPWFDQLKEPLAGIAAGAPWWRQIQEGIENVDDFLFVISPNSISSPYCHAEINYARERGKRLVPVLYCGWIGEGETRIAIDAAIEAISDDEEMPDSVTSSVLNLKKLVRQNWLAISDIQYVVFSSSFAFEQSLEQLVQALDLDLAWVRMHSQLVQAAKLWEANGFDDDYLWGANRLKPVHEMIERRKPELDPLVQDFIQPEQERLLRELDALNTSHQRRVVIGDRLGLIGDRRAGVGVKRVSRGRQTAMTIPDIVWCFVEAAQTKAPRRRMDEISRRAYLVRPFYIARYMVTHRQFQAFLDDPEGFDNSRWWQGIPEEYQRQEVAPATNQFENAPRDTVSWYHAVAFTRWLDFHYRALKQFEEFSVYVEGGEQSPVYRSISLDPDKWLVRLPTEWEWQWAAQGGEEARGYPWGRWDDQPRANTSEVGINNRSTAVGLYPDGAARCGALDMSGNLSEWCLNVHDIYGPANVEIEGEASRGLRGGSFEFEAGQAHCAYRDGSIPFYLDDYIGFRVVVGTAP